MVKPTTPDRPTVTAAGPSSLRIQWSIPVTEPEVTASTLKVRIKGSQRFHNFDFASGRLVPKGGTSVPAPNCDVIVEGCEEGLEFEAIVAAMNSEGWGEPSDSSVAVGLGQLKPREKPCSPAPPKLAAAGAGKLRITWLLPEACPPIEASQVQITDVGSGLQLLVDAGNGKMVPSGRTTFASTRLECNVTGVKEGVEYVAAICCRNAEGFGPYSMASEPIVLVDPRLSSGSSMALVVCQGPSAEVPVVEPLAAGEGKMKVRWSLPEDAKSTTVKLRRVGDKNWHLCGGTAIAAPVSETIAAGLDEGIEYEAMVSFLVNGRWCCESSISKPACIGDLKLPGIPEAPKEPRLLVVDVGQCHMKVKWQLVTTVPPLIGAVVKFRALGARLWSFVNPATGELVEEEPDIVHVPQTEVDVRGLTQGIRYEAGLAFRNKLGTGPDSALSEPVVIGRLIPRLCKCTYCFQDFDLQHAEYTKGPETFWCPPCRFRHMDPFNAVVEPYGLLMCHVVMRPTIAFSLDLPDLKAWRKEDNAIFIRMVKIDSDNSSQVWPQKISFEANGNEVFAVKEAEEGHVRRDVPKDISPGLRPGMNTIVIRMEDPYLPGFVMCLVRTQQKTPHQIAAEIPVFDEESSKNRVNALLADTWSTPLDNEEDEEITCVVSNKLKLRCPLSFERVVIPVRGEQCLHLQCFGLAAYLESNMKMRALNNRWTCPVCSNILKPSDLRVDGYVERVLAETQAHIEEVLILQDGSYRVIEELLPDKAAEKAAAAAAAAAAAEAEAEEMEMKELPTTIDDGDTKRTRSPKRNRPAQVSVVVPLTKRQKRRQKMNEVDNDSD